MGGTNFFNYGPIYEHDVIYNLLSVESWAADKKNKLMWLCHQLLSGFLSNGHLPRVSYQSANDNGDNKVKTKAVHRSVIYFSAEENPGKLRKDRTARQEGRMKERRKGWGLIKSVFRRHNSGSLGGPNFVLEL